MTMRQLMAMRVAELDWSVRVWNMFRTEGIITFWDLCQRSESELLRVPNFGRVSLREVVETLHGVNLHLGMENYPFENWALTDAEFILEDYT